jgi:hypothetical protein
VDREVFRFRRLCRYGTIEERINKMVQRRTWFSLFKLFAPTQVLKKLVHLGALYFDGLPGYRSRQSSGVAAWTIVVRAGAHHKCARMTSWWWVVWVMIKDISRGYYWVLQKEARLAEKVSND